MNHDHTKDLADTLAMSNHILTTFKFNPKKYARITFDKGERDMMELKDREDPIAKLLRVQGEAVNVLLAESLERKVMIHPERLRKIITGDYSLMEAFSNEKKVSGRTLEEAIENLIKRDRERGKEITRLKNNHGNELDSKNGEINRLKNSVANETKNYLTMTREFSNKEQELKATLIKEKAKGLGCQRLVKLIKKKASIGQASSEGARLILEEHKVNEKALRDKTKAVR